MELDAHVYIRILKEKITDLTIQNCELKTALVQKEIAEQKEDEK